MSRAPALELDGLRCKRGPTSVLKDVGMAVAPATVQCLLGANGAGKSTLLNVVMGLVPLSAGRVLLGESDISRWPIHRRADAGLRFLPQDAASFGELTVADNVRAIGECLGLRRGDLRQRVEEALATVGLEALARRRYDRISGGERKRVEIAKCLLSEPAFLLLDEPYAALDPLSIESINAVLLRLSANGCGILVADHRFEIALGISDAAWVLHEGRIVAAGSSDEVRCDPRAVALYFGYGGGIR